jgi:hypothetical protein
MKVTARVVGVDLIFLKQRKRQNLCPSLAPTTSLDRLS